MLSNLERGVFLAFFISHIPITMFIDSQGVLPKAWFPEAAVQLVDWYSSSEGFGDELMAQRPIQLDWFRHIVNAEVFLQFPFFFVANFMLYRRQNGLRLPALVYGSHVVTTMIPILGHLYLMKDISDAKKARLIGVYAPYLLVPLWLVVAMLRGPPFEDRTSKKRS